MTHLDNDPTNSEMTIPIWLLIGALIVVAIVALTGCKSVPLSTMPTALPSTPSTSTTQPSIQPSIDTSRAVAGDIRSIITVLQGAMDALFAAIPATERPAIAPTTQRASVAIARLSDSAVRLDTQAAQLVDAKAQIGSLTAERDGWKTAYGQVVEIVKAQGKQIADIQQALKDEKQGRADDAKSSHRLLVNGLMGLAALVVAGIVVLGFLSHDFHFLPAGLAGGAILMGAAFCIDAEALALPYLKWIIISGVSLAMLLCLIRLGYYLLKNGTASDALWDTLTSAKGKLRQGIAEAVKAVAPAPTPAGGSA